MRKARGEVLSPVMYRLRVGRENNREMDAGELWLLAGLNSQSEVRLMADFVCAKGGFGEKPVVVCTSSDHSAVCTAKGLISTLEIAATVTLDCRWDRRCSGGEGGLPGIREETEGEYKDRVSDCVKVEVGVTKVVFVHQSVMDTVSEMCELQENLAIIALRRETVNNDIEISFLVDNSEFQLYKNSVVAEEKPTFREITDEYLKLLKIGVVSSVCDFLKGEKESCFVTFLGKLEEILENEMGKVGILLKNTYKTALSRVTLQYKTALSELNANHFTEINRFFVEFAQKQTEMITKITELSNLIAELSSYSAETAKITQKMSDFDAKMVLIPVQIANLRQNSPQIPLSVPKEAQIPPKFPPKVSESPPTNSDFKLLLGGLKKKQTGKDRENQANPESAFAFSQMIACGEVKAPVEITPAMNQRIQEVKNHLQDAYSEDMTPELAQFLCTRPPHPPLHPHSPSLPLLT